MNSRVLIIVGMHRSFTSLVSQWLQSCGLRIGQKLFPGDIGNIQGHFEDSDFLELHKQLLKNRNMPWTGFVNTPIGRLTNKEKELLCNLIDTKNRESAEWGWKDPRTCLFLTEYGQALPYAYYLIVIRNFNETVNSLIAREFKMHNQRFKTKKGLSRLKWLLYKKKSENFFYKKFSEPYLKVWIHYYEQIIQHLQALPLTRFFVIHYSYLLANDEKVFSYLNDEWLFSLNYISFKKIYKENLLSDKKDIAPYIKDAKLLEKALRIEKTIGNYFTLTSLYNTCN